MSYRLTKFGRRQYLAFLVSLFKQEGGLDINDIDTISMPLLLPSDERPKWLYYRYENENIWHSKHQQYARKLIDNNLLRFDDNSNLRVCFTKNGYEEATKPLLTKKDLALLVSVIGVAATVWAVW